MKVNFNPIKKFFRNFWYKYIGKYELVDTSRKRVIPYDQDIFALTKKQTDELRGLYPKEYIFKPTGIGTIFEVKFDDDDIRDLTDYDSW